MRRCAEELSPVSGPEGERMHRRSLAQRVQEQKPQQHWFGLEGNSETHSGPPRARDEGQEARGGARGQNGRGCWPGQSLLHQRARGFPTARLGGSLSPLAHPITTTFVPDWQHPGDTGAALRRGMEWERAHLLDVLQRPAVLGLRLLDLQQAAGPLVILSHAHFLSDGHRRGQEPPAHAH